MSCAGFDADGEDYIAAGPGVVYSGTLHDLPSDQQNALADPQLQWPAGHAVAYRMTITLVDDNSAQALNATQIFHFGANAGEVVTVPVAPTAPTATTAGVTPATTTPATTTSTQTAIPVRGVGLAADSATRKGALSLALTAYGKGKITAIAYLYPKAKPLKGKKRKLVLLGRATIRTQAAGPVKLSIKARKPALKRLRSSASRYRIRVVFTTTYANAATSKSYTTRFWVSRKSLATLAKRPR
jgi:hypothetical protein